MDGVEKKHVCARLQWPELEKRFRRHCATDWSAYFIAGKHGLEKELEWAKQRPSLKKPPSRRLSRSPFEAALDNREWGFLTEYKDMHKGLRPSCQVDTDTLQARTHSRREADASNAEQ